MKVVVLSSLLGLASSAILKLGIVLDTSGAFYNALTGYKMYETMVNQAGGIAVGPAGNKTTYTVQVVYHETQNPSDPYWESTNIGYNATTKSWYWRNGYSGTPPAEVDRHYTQQRRLFTEDLVNFELGGTTSVAANETFTSSIMNMINMVCCVGPDSTYQQSFPTETVFGLQCSNTKAILTLSIKGARSIAITYSDSTFTKSTCLAAKGFALNQAATAYNLTYEKMYPNAWELTTGLDGKPDYTSNPVNVNGIPVDLAMMFTEVAESNPDVWIHCGAMKSGVFGLLHHKKIGFRAKATLMTTAPNTVSTFMNLVGDLGHYVLAVGQWHPAMRYKDPFFGTGPAYASQYLNITGLEAEYVGAGASASAYVLTEAIKSYYATRPHIPGVFHTDGIVAQLKQTRIQTFFGDVEFNSYRRNVAKEPATMQLIPDASNKYGVEEKCVLPLAFGNYEIVYPDPRSASNCPTNKQFCNDYKKSGLFFWEEGSIKSDKLIGLNCDVCSGLGHCDELTSECSCHASGSGMWSEVTSLVLEGKNRDCSDVLQLLDVQLDSISPVVFYVLVAIASLSIFGVVYLILKYKSIGKNQPTLFLVIQVGVVCVVIAAGLFLRAHQVQDSASCEASLWLYIVGFVIVEGITCLKLRRIEKIFGNKSFLPVVIPDHVIILQMLFVMFLSIIIFMVVGHFISPLTLNPVISETRMVSVLCYDPSVVVSYIPLVLMMGALLITTSVYSWTYNSLRQYTEGTKLLPQLFMIILFSITVLVLFIISKESPVAYISLMLVAMVLPISVVNLSIFVDGMMIVGNNKVHRAIIQAGRVASIEDTNMNRETVKSSLGPASLQKIPDFDRVEDVLSAWSMFNNSSKVLISASHKILGSQRMDVTYRKEWCNLATGIVKDINGIVKVHGGSSGGAAGRNAESMLVDPGGESSKENITTRASYVR